MNTKPSRIVYRMRFEAIHHFPDGTQEIDQLIENRIEDAGDSDGPSDSIGILMGMMANSLCNCDDPWPDALAAAFLTRVHNISDPFRTIAWAFGDWRGEEDFDEFVRVERIKKPDHQNDTGATK